MIAIPGSYFKEQLTIKLIIEDEGWYLKCVIDYLDHYLYSSYRHLHLFAN
jgi:hypothetical protein